MSEPDEIKAAVAELATEGKRLRARLAKHEAALAALSVRVGAQAPAVGGGAQRGAGGEGAIKDLRSQRDDAQFRLDRANALLKEILAWQEANPAKRGCHEPVPYRVMARLVDHLNEK